MAVPWTVRLAATAFVAWSAHQWWLDRPVEPPAGVLAPGDPLQTPVEDGRTSLPARGGWHLTARARYTVTARVLSRETYRWDGFASAAPVDVALGWGPMSDSAVLAPLEISQGARFYTVRWREEPPRPPAEIMAHSANTHLIPADDALGRRLARLRRGQLVRLEGYLVDGDREDGATFRTSLTRYDTGAGACEVLYVERAEVLAPQRP
jgi:hypothetical protein